MTAPWTPPRPERHTAAWERRAERPAGTAPREGVDDETDGDGTATSAGDGPRGGTGRPGRPARLPRALGSLGRGVGGLWRRASRGRRTAVALTALLLVSGLVVALGSTAQPVYPALAPTGDPVGGTDAFGRIRSSDPVELDELRELPTTPTWTTDLRAAIAPTATAGCVSFQQIGSVDSDVLIGTSWLGGDGSDCRDSVGRVARFDPRTGRVVWVADIRAALGIDDPQYVTVYPGPDGRSAVVALSRQVGTPAVRLDLRSGEVTGVVVPPDDVTASGTEGDAAAGSSGGDGEAGDSPDASGSSDDSPDASADSGYDPDAYRSSPRTGSGSGSGSGSDAEPSAAVPAGGVHSLTTAIDGAVLVATVPRQYFDGSGAMSYSSDDTFHYDLARLDDPTTPIWSGDVVSTSYPIVTAGRLFVELAGGHQISVDITTGDVTRWPDSLLGVQGTVVIDGHLYVVTTDESDSGTERNTLSALGEGAVVRWSAATSSGSLPQPGPGCLIVADPRERLTCLDVDTGEPLWRVAPELEPGQSARQVYSYDRPAAQDVFVQVSRPNQVVVDSDSGGVDDADDTRLVAYDARTGEQRYDVAVPGLVYLAGTSRTTGYAVSYSSTSRFGASVVTAFDLADGHRLWRLDDSDVATVEFWRGTLVTVSQSGVAHGLLDDVSLAG